MTQPVPVTVARGDGIGPEITDATLRVLEAAGAAIEPEFIVVGEAAYLAGHASGIPPEAWESLRRTRLFLKGPITTPQGGGYKSLNVTIRKMLGLYANVRPCVSYAPLVPSAHPGMDVVIVRENEEDLYAGIEHRQTDDVYQCLKLITRPGCSRIVRYAFEYARAHGRRKVTCMTKDNIMKLTDGLFHRVFDEVAREYPEIEAEHYIIDIGAARLATRPTLFDVVVTPNLYGDILSDIAAEVAGSIGLAGSANIGTDIAMFEAVHGSAPDIAGTGVANPGGLLMSAVMMLVHIGQTDVAERIHNAWLAALEDGIATADIARDGAAVSTAAFADAVIARLGRRPARFRAVDYRNAPRLTAGPADTGKPQAQKVTIGVDVFVHARTSPADLAQRLHRANPVNGHGGLALQMITNRGVKVWPDGLPETFCTDHWRCRLVAVDGAKRPRPVARGELVSLLGAFEDDGIEVIKTEHLCTFDGAPGYALGHGQ
ncbi:MAG: NADP-dependent isocitrate dehydrogenase [Betaproteobacteria bacterium]